MAEIRVKEVSLINNKWAKTNERKLNASDDQAISFKEIKLVSENDQKSIILKLDDDGVLKIVDGTQEFRVLTSGINSQSGTVIFNHSKQMQVTFPKPFKKWPAISLTLGDVSNSPPWRIYPGKTRFTIKFKEPYTGEVQWIASEI